MIDEITERHKCRVHVFTADVGDEAEVAALLERIRAELPPLAGVAHLAGVLDDALLSQQDLDRFRKTLAPKAFGADHLDRLTRDDDLDFFIVSSSVSSLFGSPGQANYATANAFLDGLVARRRAQGLPATGVNFGPWARGGMASSEAATRQHQCPGPDPAGAVGRARRPRRGGRQRHRPGRRDQGQLAARRQGAGQFAAADPGPGVAAAPQGRSPATASCSRQLQEIPVAQRAGFVTEFLQREVQNFLRLAQPPAASQPLPGPGHGLVDGDRAAQPAAQSVRWRVHDQRHRGLRLPDHRRAGRVPGGPAARRRQRHRPDAEADAEADPVPEEAV